MSRITLNGPQVTFRIFSLIHEDRERFRRAYRKVLLTATLISYPAFATLVVVAPPILSRSVWRTVAVGGGPVSNPLPRGNAQDTECVCQHRRTGHGTESGPRSGGRSCPSCSSLLAVAAFSRWGIEGAAFGVLAASLTMSVLMHSMLRGATGLTVQDVLAPQVPAITCAAGAATIAVLVGYALHAMEPTPRPWVVLIAQISSAMAFFLGFILLLVSPRCERSFERLCSIWHPVGRGPSRCRRHRPWGVYRQLSKLECPQPVCRPRAESMGRCMDEPAADLLASCAATLRPVLHWRAQPPAVARRWATEGLWTRQSAQVRCLWTSRRRCYGTSHAFPAGIDSSYSGPRGAGAGSLARQDAGPLIAYVFYPKFWPYIQYLDADYLVYHAYDLFERNRGWSKKLDVFQRLLMQRADLAISSSEAIGNALESRYGRAPTVIANGADYDAFVGAASTGGPEPTDLSAIPRPRIGYAGALSRKVDFELIAKLARRRRQWQFVLIGEVRSLDGPLPHGARGGPK